MHASPVTCVQQPLDNVEVGMGHTVVQGGVAVAVRHIDHVPQHGARDTAEGSQVVLYHGRHGRLLAGNAEPLLLHGVQARPLQTHRAKNNRKGVSGEAVTHTGVLVTGAIRNRAKTVHSLLDATTV